MVKVYFFVLSFHSGWLVRYTKDKTIIIKSWLSAFLLNHGFGDDGLDY